MKKKLNRGEGMLDAVLIIAFLLFVLLVTPKSSSPAGGNWLSGPALFGSASSGTGGNSGISFGPASISSRSASGSVSLSTGNAPYEDEAYKEYIELQNFGNSPLDITGWTLKNGKDQRTYQVGGSLQKFSADIAAIPQGYALMPAQGGMPQDIILKPGERAVITTGSFGVKDPVNVRSFKENACTGYIQGLDGYSFDPSLDASCPNPSQEPGVENLDRDCRDFINTLPSCKTPKFDTRQANGDTCTTCINGRYLSASCAAFVKAHFSYPGCIVYHAEDKDFNDKRTWRVFLGRAWEMWSDKYETMNVFDRLGNLIVSQSY